MYYTPKKVSPFGFFKFPKLKIKKKIKNFGNFYISFFFFKFPKLKILNLLVISFYKFCRKEILSNHQKNFEDNI